jgi:hypothetical protein
MRVYVAGSSAELDRCERVIAALRAGGCTITFDWCAQMREFAARGLCDASLDDHEARRCAETDLTAVELADAVLLLAPETATRGAWVEFGYAIASFSYGHDRGLRSLYVSGSAARQSIFTRCADALFLSDDDAVSAIVRSIVRGPVRIEVPA